MIILDQATQTLEIILDAAVSLAESTWFISYVEIDGPNNNAFSGISGIGSTNGNTAVTLIDASAGDGVINQLKSFSLVNEDNAPIAVTIRVNDTATIITDLIYVVLQVNDNLQYIDTRGFFVIDNNGNEKLVLAQPTLSGSDGQLPNAKGTLYTATGNERLIGITLVNSDNGAYTVNLYLNRSGTSRRIIPKDKPLPDELEFPPIANIKHTLNVGDLVEGDASSANKVDYVISTEKLP